DDDLEVGGRRRRAPEVDVDTLDRFEEDRLARVPAANLGAPLTSEVRVGGQPGPADPDEVETPTLEWSSAHRPVPASARSSSATTSAASGFASAFIASLIRERRAGSPRSSPTSAGTPASSD